MILVVTHRLDPLRQTLFYNALDFLGPWCRLNPSTWLLSTNRSPSEITALLHAETGGDHLSAGLLDPDDIVDFPAHARAWVESRRR